MKAPAGDEALGDPVVWHDAECGDYAADLPLWAELAAGADRVLELGCGTGRVALHLARRGVEVWGVDRDPVLLDALERRAAEEGLRVHAIRGDVRELSLGEAFPLVLAPMQLLQILGGAGGRAALLERARAHLAPRGLLAAAIIGEPPRPVDPGEVLPDVREVSGWVHSSLPVEIRSLPAAIEVRRLRQLVSPDGELRDAVHVDRLDLLSAETLEEEARAAGLDPAGRREVLPTESHLGSLAVLLRRA